tara:strand:+ start:1214 stop:1516 length:303 start_codon:yes stop_codon:yes gene_type:complete
MADDCPTCRAVEALLVGSRRVPKPVARKIARSSVTREADKAIRRTKTVRKASEYQKKLSKHMKIEREKATKKDGSYRKGMSQAKVMARAHKCVKKEMNKR